MMGELWLKPHIYRSKFLKITAMATTEDVNHKNNYFAFSLFLIANP
jgi:hypothetical protein